MSDNSNAQSPRGLTLLFMVIASDITILGFLFIKGCHIHPILGILTLLVTLIAGLFSIGHCFENVIDRWPD